MLEALQNSREQTENTKEKIKEKDSSGLGSLLGLGTAAALAIKGALLIMSPLILADLMPLIKQAIEDALGELVPIPTTKNVENFLAKGRDDKFQNFVGSGWDLSSKMLNRSADAIESMPLGVLQPTGLQAMKWATRLGGKITDAYSEAIKDPKVIDKFREDLSKKSLFDQVSEVFFTPRGFILAHMDIASMALDKFISKENPEADKNLIRLQNQINFKKYNEDIYGVIDRLTPLSSTPEKEYRYVDPMEADSQYINEQLSKDLLLEEPPTSDPTPKPQTKAKPKPEKGQWVTSGDDGKPIVLIPGQQVDGMDIPPVVVPSSAAKSADLNFLNEQLGQMVGQLKSSEESQLRSEQTLNEINKNLQESNRGPGTIYNNNTYVEGARPTLSELTRD